VKYRLDTGMIGEVEHNLTPPMKQAITIPLGEHVVIYIATSPFGPTLTDSELRVVASQVAAALSGEVKG
jgi:hypothetical protein